MWRGSSTSTTGRSSGWGAPGRPHYRTRKGAERGLRNLAAFTIGFLTGLRLHEITSLTVGQLLRAYPAPSGGVYVTIVVKGRKKIDSHFQPPVLNAVRDYRGGRGLILETMEPKESIWSGLSDHALRQAIVSTARHAGLGHVTPHVMRYTYAKCRRRVSSDIEVIQLALRHSWPSTTDRYPQSLEPATDERWQDVARVMGF